MDDTQPAEGTSPPSKAPRPLWAHPGLWMLVAFGYCTPGFFVVEELFEPTWWYYYGSPVVVALGAAIAWIGRGWKAGIGTALLMVLAGVVAILINFEIACSSGC